MAGENTRLIEDSPLLSMDPQVREFVNSCPVPITPDSGSGPGPVTVPGHGPSPGPSGLPTLPTPTTATGSAAASNRILSRNANGTKVFTLDTFDRCSEMLEKEGKGILYANFFPLPLALFFSLIPRCKPFCAAATQALGLPAASLGKADDMLQLPVLYVELLGKQ
ncbi:hypothetical protein CEXT_378571 [Caerostris extrusa]|uniref:Uncharacterized protein n=1 Tax=Caerostris extrusa TaxID=172846 RepID=A0AAV4UQV9_CAEEX|nr:hypothetical protein CEXT_378571 [Caerostris extrusa]